MDLTLDIIKAERKGDEIFITFQDMNIETLGRKFKYLYKAARDSAELSLDSPVALINNISFPMRKHGALLQWSLCIPSRTSLQIIYGGKIHELGDI